MAHGARRHLHRSSKQRWHWRAQGGSASVAATRCSHARRGIWGLPAAVHCAERLAIRRSKSRESPCAATTAAGTSPSEGQEDSQANGGIDGQRDDKCLASGGLWGPGGGVRGVPAAAGSGGGDGGDSTRAAWRPLGGAVIAGPGLVSLRQRPMRRHAHQGRTVAAHHRSSACTPCSRSQRQSEELWGQGQGIK